MFTSSSNSIVIQEPMGSPKVWSIEVSDKAKTILMRMQADIRQRKAEMPKLNTDGFSGKFNNPSRAATDKESILKVKMEAKVTRAKVPPDLRAELYGDQKDTSELKAEFFGMWDNAAQSRPKPSRSKMTSGFNRATGITSPPHAGQKCSPQRSHSQPYMEI